MPRPLVTLNDEGHIQRVEQWQRLDTIAQTEFYAGALCAGFVNMHCHIELSYLRGQIERGSGFAGFARKIGQVRGNFTAEERQRALRAADGSLWAQGVDAVADIINGETSLDMKAQSHIRYTSFAEVFGLNSTVEPMQQIAERWSGVSLTPHSTYSLQSDTFAATVTAAKRSNSPLSIHFLESEAEKALYQDEGSLAEWYGRMGWECDFLHHGSPTQRIVDTIDGSQRLLLIHNCFAEREDVELLQTHFGEGVSWVLCPRSNDYISGLRPPVELLREMGCRICIGTDSLASNESLSMVEEMKCFMDIPLRELITWATQNGAEALGLGDEIGTVEEGYRSGIVLLEGITADTNGELWLTEKTTSRRLI